MGQIPSKKVVKTPPSHRHRIKNMNIEMGTVMMPGKNAPRYDTVARILMDQPMIKSKLRRKLNIALSLPTSSRRAPQIGPRTVKRYADPQILDAPIRNVLDKYYPIAFKNPQWKYYAAPNKSVYFFDSLNSDPYMIHKKTGRITRPFRMLNRETIDNWKRHGVIKQRRANHTWDGYTKRAQKIVNKIQTFPERKSVLDEISVNVRNYLDRYSKGENVSTHPLTKRNAGQLIWYKMYGDRRDDFPFYVKNKNRYIRDDNLDKKTLTKNMILENLRSM